MPLEEHNPELAGLEAALAALAPMPGRINRDALLFRAGQASVRGRGWAWPATAAALGLMAVTLAVVLATQGSPVDRIVYVTIKEPATPVREAVQPMPEPDPASSGPIATRESPMNYLELERQVFRWGLDGVPALPEARPTSGPPLTRDSLLSSAPETAPLPKFFDLGSFFQ